MKCSLFLCFLLHLTTDRWSVFSDLYCIHSKLCCWITLFPKATDHQVWVVLPSRMLYRSARLSQWGVGGLNHRNVWSCSSGGQSRKSKCQQGWLLLRAVRIGFCPGFSPVTCRWMFSSCVSSHCLASVHTPVVKAPAVWDTGAIVLVPTPLPHFTFPYYKIPDPNTKVICLRFWGLGLEHINNTGPQFDL